MVNVATTAKAETHSSVAMAPDGRFDVAYQLQFSSSDDDILLNRSRADGRRCRHDRGRHQHGEREQAPSISMDDFGNAVVAYQKFDPGFLGFGGDWDIKARRVSAHRLLTAARSTSGTPRSDEVHPSVALRRGGGGGFVVGYDRSGASRWRRSRPPTP